MLYIKERGNKIYIHRQLKIGAVLSFIPFFIYIFQYIPKIGLYIIPISYMIIGISLIMSIQGVNKTPIEHSQNTPKIFWLHILSILLYSLLTMLN